jgi:hypothetical protein
MVTFRSIYFIPRLIGMNGEPGDIHPTALDVDEEQHLVGHQPAQRQHLCGEKIGPRQQRQVGSMKAAHAVVRLRSSAGGRPWRRRTLPTA